MLEKIPYLSTDDILSAPAGTTGEDLKLSPLAREAFPFDVECKSHKAFSVYKHMEQAENHKKEREVKTYPLVCLKGNRKQPLIFMYAEDFLHILYDDNE